MKKLKNDIKNDELESEGERLLEEWGAEDQPIGEVSQIYDGDPSDPQSTHGCCNNLEVADGGKVRKLCTRCQLRIEAARIDRAYRKLVAAI